MSRHLLNRWLTPSVAHPVPRGRRQWEGSRVDRSPTESVSTPSKEVVCRYPTYAVDWTGIPHVVRPRLERKHEIAAADFAARTGGSRAWCMAVAGRRPTGRPSTVSTSLLPRRRPRLEPNSSATGFSSRVGSDAGQRRRSSPSEVAIDTVSQIPINFRIRIPCYFQYGPSLDTVRSENPRGEDCL